MSDAPAGAAAAGSTPQTNLREPLSPDGFEAALRAIGEERYHHRHPFNLRMHAGQLTRRELQIWAANRYYYQTRIPLKDSAILSKASDPAFRREWVQRLRDHDGERDGEGGLALWLRMAELLGCDRADVEALADVAPGVRKACDAYVEFVEHSDLLASVAASLTELFAGDIMAVRIAAFERHYPWIGEEGLAYFRSRTRQAPRDAGWGLAFVRERARSVEDQQRCLDALHTKCSILWSLLDSVECAASRPHLSPQALLRTDDPSGAAVVVLAERAVRIEGSGGEILALCDGERRGEEVAAEMAARHAHSGTREEAQSFLEAMVREGVLVLATGEAPGDGD